MTDPVITHHPEARGHRGTFDLDIDGRRAGFLSYSLDGPATMVIDYVQVDPSLRGRKLGDRLVAAAVDWARANQRRIVPICSFARAVMRRTKAFQDVLE
jgi:predicted GNAT family acetyltransferase